jgi:hypothetical protein
MNKKGGIQMTKRNIQNVFSISTQMTQIREGAKGTNNEHFLMACLPVACCLLLAAYSSFTCPLKISKIWIQPQ